MIGDPINTLLSILIIVGAVIVGAVIILIIQSNRSRNAQLEQNSEKAKATENKKPEFSKEDVRKFLDFEKIEDDMIIQDKGNRFVMVLRCQGINYDLMSEPEMLSVEEGFSNFLNTLKYPIQLYVQARSLNLEDGINVYKDRIMKLREEYDKYENSVAQAKRTRELSNKERNALDFEMKKKKTLLEYGGDIVSYIEKMSMNKNILQRKYYVVVSYHTSELGIATNFTKEEARDLAYSELYTRCRSIAGALTSCGVDSSILKSEELAELLYVAYNKDEADVFSLRKALDSGVYRLYSTSQDIMEKKQKVIDNAVHEQAVAEAELALQNAIVKMKEANNGLTYEEQASDSAKAQAMQMILDNSDQFEQEVVDTALNDLNSQMHVPVVDFTESTEEDEDKEKKVVDEVFGNETDNEDGDVAEDVIETNTDEKEES